ISQLDSSEIQLHAYSNPPVIDSNVNAPGDIHYSLYPNSKSTEPIIPPPPDIQPLVDQVAYQISRKGGEDLERKLKAENDINYDFLFPNNKYH
ncbi:hypothetical protein, partial [Salmonella sp. s54836]|uniref:hypothetical protein n=1 Tax=Salmonella sp. s54836 TaxID=3159673 RepID=UPI00397E9C8B